MYEKNITLRSSGDAPPREPLIKHYYYNATPAIEYECWAPAGSSLTDAVWAIKKYVYNATPAVVDELWAYIPATETKGNSNFNKVADNHANYNYS